MYAVFSKRNMQWKLLNVQMYKVLISLFLFFFKNTKMQMMNIRSDSENGSTVKSLNQDAVIGQTFLSSVLSQSPWIVLDASDSVPVAMLMCLSNNDSIKVSSVLTVLQFADRSEDQIWHTCVSHEHDKYAMSSQANMQNAKFCQFVLLPPPYLCSCFFFKIGANHSTVALHHADFAL